MNNNYKRFHVLKYLLIFILVTASTSVAQISVSLPQITRISGAADEYINLTVGQITTQDNVTAFQFRIQYDPNIISITGVTASGSTFNGVNSDPTSNAGTANGTLKFAWASSSPISGSGTLVRIGIHYKNLGSTSLAFSDTTNFKNLFNTGTPSMTTTNGSISVVTALPTLNITSPIGGENWSVGSTHNITWTSSNISNVKIEYTTDNGTSWSTINNSTNASSGTYLWLVPNTITTQAKIRLSDSSNASINSVSNSVFTISPAPTITITSPVGGEIWQGGSTHNITWTSTSVNYVKIEYTTNNGTTWATISPATASTGSYLWTVPNTPTVQAKVRISDTSNATTNSVSNSVFTITSTPSINMQSPSGGENWQVGSTHNITWTSTNVNFVKIEYSTDNGTTWSLITSSLLASTGSYSWIVPNTITTQAKVRISDTSNAVINSISNTFTISPIPIITVTSPNGGEIWVGGSTHNITWTSTNVNFVKIEYSLNNGTTWVNIASGLASNLGTYSWVVPDTSATQALVRISDTSNVNISDISNSIFTITKAPKITVTSPNGGETWVGGSTHNITWTSINVTNVKIEYTLNNGSSWSTIINSIPSNGLYNWTIPDTISAQARIRISNSIDSTISTVSNIFTINYKPKILITSPSGGEDWEAKSIHDITWTNINFTDNIKIEYSLNNGSNWILIIDNQNSSSGKYSWTLPQSSSTQAIIRITSDIDPSITTESNIFKISPITGIDFHSTEIPKIYSLSQNYPNPFNPSTNINFTLPKISKVVLKIYNVLGQEVATLVNQELSAGKYNYEFNATNMSSGIYIYRLQAGDNVFIKKMTLLK